MAQHLLLFPRSHKREWCWSALNLLNWSTTLPVWERFLCNTWFLSLSLGSVCYCKTWTCQTSKRIWLPLGLTVSYNSVNSRIMVISFELDIHALNSCSKNSQTKLRTYKLHVLLKFFLQYFWEDFSSHLGFFSQSRTLKSRHLVADM